MNMAKWLFYTLFHPFTKIDTLAFQLYLQRHCQSDIVNLRIGEKI